VFPCKNVPLIEGLVVTAPRLGGHILKKYHFRGLNRHFNQNSQNIKLASTSTKISPVIKTIHLVVQRCVSLQRIQDGGRPPFWNLLLNTCFLPNRTAKIIITKLTSVSLYHRSHWFKTAIISTLSLNSKRAQTANWYECVSQLLLKNNYDRQLSVRQSSCRYKKLNDLFGYNLYSRESTT